MKTREIRAWWPNGATVDLQVDQYPDGLPNVRYTFTDAPARLLVRPSSVASLMTALWFVDALRDRGLRTPELILPHVPGGRQDRINAEGDYLFTLKSVAREINLRRFPKVTVLDPHSDVTGALIDRCEVVHVVPFGKTEYDAVVSPDAGAEKRAARVAKSLTLPLLHAWKTRNVNTGAISGFGMEPLPTYWQNTVEDPRHVLVVDDICDAGGTFIGLAEVLKQSHLTADLFTTHGYYSKGTDALIDAGYRRLLTTDSILRDARPSPLEVLMTCETLLTKGTL